jgi:toxin secretion/phage lysis holin
MDKYFAMFVGFVASIVSYAVDGLGLAVTVLIGMMAIDYVTGLLSAAINHSLNSRIGFFGVARKIYYLLLVGSVYLISLVIPGIEYAGDGVAVALAVLELISITENGVALGLPIPQYVQNLLLIVKNKSETPGGDGK